MTAASSGPDSFRVIHHERICPDCGSDDIAADNVDMADGTAETAYICRDCGEAWPMACVTEWSVRPRRRAGRNDLTRSPTTRPTTTARR